MDLQGGFTILQLKIVHVYSHKLTLKLHRKI